MSVSKRKKSILGKNGKKEKLARNGDFERARYFVMKIAFPVCLDAQTFTADAD